MYRFNAAFPLGSSTVAADHAFHQHSVFSLANTLVLYALKAVGGRHWILMAFVLHVDVPRQVHLVLTFLAHASADKGGNTGLAVGGLTGAATGAATGAVTGVTGAFVTGARLGRGEWVGSGA